MKASDNGTPAPSSCDTAHRYDTPPGGESFYRLNTPPSMDKGRVALSTKPTTTATGDLTSSSVNKVTESSAAKRPKITFSSTPAFDDLDDLIDEYDDDIDQFESPPQQAARKAPVKIRIVPAAAKTNFDSPALDTEAPPPSPDPSPPPTSRVISPAKQQSKGNTICIYIFILYVYSLSIAI